MLVPRDQGITLWTLRYGDVVRDPDDYFDAIKPEKPEAKLLSLALSLIKERTERWDQKMVSDPVQDNLRKIIAARKKGARKTPKAKAAEPVEQAGNVVNIMEALQRSEEHTSELPSLMRISYAVFCLQKTKIYITIHTN